MSKKDNAPRERAELTAADSEEILFLLSDSTHEFTIGLSDVLSAIKFAEDEGALPKLPAEWWEKVTA